jgi:Skp family chaperone for outer membrane proteins
LRLTKQEITTIVSLTLGGCLIVLAGLLVTNQIPLQDPFARRLCSMDRKAVFERSTMGRTANNQFMALKTKIQSEIVAEKNRIESLARGPSAPEVQQLLALLQQRVLKENARLEAVRVSVTENVIDRFSPTIRRIGVQNNCDSILDRRNFVYLGRVSDLTSQTIEQVQRDIPPLPANLVADLYKNQTAQKN